MVAGSISLKGYVMASEFAKAMSQMGNELKRLGTQGAAEVGGALFNGNAYVPYGDGQQSPPIDEGVQSQGFEPPQVEMDSGMEM